MIMKTLRKMMTAVLMMMAVCVTNAQSTNDGIDRSVTFERITEYLNIGPNQIAPFGVAIEQLVVSIDVMNNLDDSQKTLENSDKIIKRHKKTVKRILTKKQYNKYCNIIDLTIQNHIDKHTK
jgi:hypothetical protein